MRHITKDQAQGLVKELKKLFNKETMPSLKAHWQRELAKAQSHLAQLRANDSLLKPSRSPFSKLPKAKYELLH